MGKLIELYQASKVYEKKWYALDNVTLKIDQGEFVFITGPSGAGKSTLLSLIYMAEKPSSGAVIVNDVKANQASEKDIALLRRDIGIVFQDFKLLNHRTVYDNLAFVLNSIGTSKKLMREKIFKALKSVELLHKQHFFPYQLSGGERQRVAIARAIVNSPKIILADEPTGNLEPERSMAIVNILMKMNYYGVTVIMATHDPSLISYANKRVIHLVQGKLVDNVYQERNIYEIGLRS